VRCGVRSRLSNIPILLRTEVLPDQVESGNRGQLKPADESIPSSQLPATLGKAARGFAAIRAVGTTQPHFLEQRKGPWPALYFGADSTERYPLGDRLVVALCQL
jgi:hypothetical protein